MRIKFEEIVCFNSLLDGAPIAGVKDTVPPGKIQEFVKKGQEQLKKHNFLDQNNKPNQQFFFGVTLLNEYKSAKRYLVINSMRAALQEGKQYVVCLSPLNGEYEFVGMSKTQLFDTLVQTHPYLSKEIMQVEYKKEDMLFDDWVELSKNECFENVMWIQEMSKEELTYPKIIYNQKHIGYIYDAFTNTLCTCDKDYLKNELKTVLHI